MAILTGLSMDSADEPLTPRWTPLRHHDEQHSAYVSEARIKVMPCGRRSGKSEYAKRILVERAFFDEIPGCVRPRYAYGGPTQDQARNIAWDDLLDLIPDRWIVGGKKGPNVSYSRMEIILANNALIRVVGLDKPHRIEGKYLNGFVGDEWSDVKHGVFDRVIRPMLGDYHGWAILCGVPKRQGIGARWYRNLCDQIIEGRYPDAAHFSWPAWDILAKSEVDEARATMDPKDFDEQYGAKWQNAGGGVWHAFTREHNVRPCQRRANLPIIVGQDYNRTPMSWVLSHRVGEIFETFDELILNNTTTERALEELWRRYGHHQGGWQFYGDASARSHTTKGEFSDYAIVWNHEKFKAAGRTCHYLNANPSHHDRFAAGNARLATADGNHRAFIDPRCVALIEDLEMRSYKPGTMELPKDEGGRGHVSDAWSYPVYRIWPIRFNVGGERKQSVIVGETQPLAAGNER